MTGFQSRNAAAQTLLAPLRSRRHPSNCLDCPSEDAADDVFMTTEKDFDSWLQLVRLPGTFTAWSSVLAAHLIATDGSPHLVVLVLQLAAVAGLYWGGMAVNDYFDLEKDRSTHPERPLPSGRITVRSAQIAAGGSLGAGIVLAALSGEQSLRVAIALAALIALYHGMLKGSFLGPLTLGACRFGIWMLGFSVLPTAGTLQGLGVPVLFYTAAFAVLSAAAARGPELGTTRKATLLAAASVTMLGAFAWNGLLPERLALLVSIPALYPLAMSLWRTRRGDAESFRQAARMFSTGMIPLDAVILAGSGHWIWGAALLGLLVADRATARRIGCD